jgi:hypothetical protein
MRLDEVKRREIRTRAGVTGKDKNTDTPQRRKGKRINLPSSPTQVSSEKSPHRIKQEKARTSPASAIGDVAEGVKFVALVIPHLPAGPIHPDTRDKACMGSITISSI